MLDILTPSDWAKTLGLAIARLFAAADQPPVGQHQMLLDGADGCFALSSYDSDFEGEPFQDWAWSSGVLHHLTILPDRIVVRRWDDRHERRSYRPGSVAPQLREFYQMLTKERSRASVTLDQHTVDVFRKRREAHI